MSQLLKITARIISFIFHPLLIPTLGFLVLMNINFYFSYLPSQMKRALFLVILTTTFILPGITFLLMNISPKFDLKMEKIKDRIVPLMATVLFYYIGYFLLLQFRVYPVYRVFLISVILTLITLLMITMRWKISLHMAGIAGLTGAIVALSFRLGNNTSILVSMLICVAGLLGTSRLLLGKHDLNQILAGYTVGFVMNFMIIFFI